MMMKLYWKLYEIFSVENFAKRVHEFYLELLFQIIFEKELTADEPVTETHFKDSIYIPQTRLHAGQGFKTYVESF